MKNVIALLMVCAGLGIDPNGNQNLEIVLGLCFFFGAINLAMPLTRLLGLASQSLFRPKRRSVRSR